MHANSLAVQDYLSTLSRSVGDSQAGLRLLGQQIQAEALTMAYNDIFWVMGMVTLAALPLILFLRPLPQGAPAASVH